MSTLLRRREMMQSNRKAEWAQIPFEASSGIVYYKVGNTGKNVNYGSVVVSVEGVTEFAFLKTTSGSGYLQGQFWVDGAYDSGFLWTDAATDSIEFEGVTYNAQLITPGVNLDTLKFSYYPKTLTYILLAR